MKLYMFRTVPLSIIRSFSLYTQQRYISYRSADSLRGGSGWNGVPSWSSSQAVSKPVWHMPLLCVQWKAPDDGQRNCPKHVEFHLKNKFEKLVHLVGFIIRNWARCTVTWMSKPTSALYSAATLNRLPPSSAGLVPSCTTIKGWQ
jgi:hypothetical protein